MIQNFRKPLNSSAQNFYPFTVKFFVSALCKSLSYLCRKVVVEEQVVHDGKSHAEHFVGFYQMSDIRFRICFADGTFAVLVYGGEVVRVFLVFDVDYAF